MELLDALVGLTARLAAAVSLDEVVDAAVRESRELGFGAVWLAVLDERTGLLSTCKAIVDGRDTTPEVPAADLRLPSEPGFRDRRMINIAGPDALQDDDSVSPEELALRRAASGQLGHPFVCGPLLGSSGEPIGALGLSSYRGAQPISDALLAHGPVRIFTDHLGLALERALRVAQLDTSLREAQAAMANDAPLTAVGRVAASVAHDLNNLCEISLMAVDVGARSPADAFNVLPRIELASRATSALVASLQRIARPPTGELETAQLPEIIDEVLTLLRPSLRERSIEIDVESAAVPPVRCDRVLVHRVVLNLFINAQDALATLTTGRRRIRLRLRYDGSMVRLIVSDSGPGIAPEVLGRLFQPFSTTKGGKHLGLGLASARTALEQFGGQIEARNAPTGGAVFELSLAAAPATRPSSPPPPAQSRAITSNPAPTAGRHKILAVDDDDDVVFIIREYLKPLGYEVATATDAARALDAASSQGFDLVLCDIGMPGHSGLDMPRALRARGYGGKLILMTGWDSHALSADPRLAECDTLLKKPFRGTELVDAISAVLATTG
jgi:signal transduction histidine kinase/CheY-like chemotaxis protein